MLTAVIPSFHPLYLQALSRAVLDISSRPYFCGHLPFTREKIGDRSLRLPYTLLSLPLPANSRTPPDSPFSPASLDRDDLARLRVVRHRRGRHASRRLHPGCQQPPHVSPYCPSSPPLIFLPFHGPPAADSHVHPYASISCSAEASFKALALAIREAVERTGGNEVPSTKGVLL